MLHLEPIVGEDGCGWPGSAYYSPFVNRDSIDLTAQVQGFQDTIEKRAFLLLIETFSQKATPQEHLHVNIQETGQAAQGETFVVPTTRGSCVAELLLAACQVTKRAPPQCALVFGGNVLQMPHTLASYHVEADAVLFLVDRPWDVLATLEQFSGPDRI